MSKNSLDEEFFQATESSVRKPWIIASSAALFILGIAIGLMWWVGLFDIPADDTGNKTLAAALALVGSVFTAVITLVGIIVKYSIDDRNARLAAIEAKSKYAMAKEAAKKNRIEVAIRAVDLLSENNKDTTDNQSSGAILSLVNLGEYDLAIALLSQLWPAEIVSGRVAHIVLSAVFKYGSEDAKDMAADVLWENVEQCCTEDYYYWPIPGLGWRTDLPNRFAIGKAAGKWLISDLKRNKQYMPVAIIVLYKALDDDDDLVKDIALSCLRPLVKAKAWPMTQECPDQKGNIYTFEQIVTRLSPFLNTYAASSDSKELESEISSLYNISKDPKLSQQTSSNST